MTGVTDRRSTWSPTSARSSLTEEQIQAKVAELGARIGADYADRR